MKIINLFVKKKVKSNKAGRYVQAYLEYIKEFLQIKRKDKQPIRNWAKDLN